MGDNKVLPGPVCSGGHAIKEAVCIHTKKVYDSCKDKDCLVDLRVYLSAEAQMKVDKAINVKPKEACLIWVYTDVEPVPFNKGFYTIDVKYFYKVKVDVFFAACAMPCEVEGIASFDKRVILFGSEGNARVFSSKYRPHDEDLMLPPRNNLPIAVVEVVDPILLSVKVVESHRHHDCCCEIPQAVAQTCGGDLVLEGENKKLLATIGQFSIIKLERDSQLLIPCYDFCIPQKECLGSSEEDPCSLFEKFKFPVDEFFPPRLEPDCDHKEKDFCGCKK